MNCVRGAAEMETNWSEQSPYLNQEEQKPQPLWENVSSLSRNLSEIALIPPM